MLYPVCLFEFILWIGFMEILLFQIDDSVWRMQNMISTLRPEETNIVDDNISVELFRMTFSIW